MTKTLNRLSLFLLVCASALALQAQTLLTTTTLSSAAGSTVSSALTTGNLGVIAVASATGISAPSVNTGNIAGLATSNAATYLYVDRELMQVVAVNSTSITVIRGVGSTAAASHASGALVFVLPAAAVANWSGGNYGMAPAVPEGSCTRTNELYLPRLQFISGMASDCLGGQWVTGDALQTTRQTNFRVPFPIIGSATYTSALGTSTATTAAELYCTELDLPYAKLLTGLAAHIGATGGTDKWIVALYDAGGNLIANSAVAGATVGGTAYAFNAEAFTAPYYAPGPAVYFGCVMSNGTTATLDLIKTGYGDLELTYKSASAGTFGTLPSFTPPTSFTTLYGPWMYAY